jgi:hypothetical protein
MPECPDQSKKRTGTIEIMTAGGGDATAWTTMIMDGTAAGGGIAARIATIGASTATGMGIGIAIATIGAEHCSRGEPF